MPKKQSKANPISNIKLRRSKTTAQQKPQSPEYLTDEDEICLEQDAVHEQYEQREQEADDNDAEFEEPQPVKQVPQKQKKIKKPACAGIPRCVARLGSKTVINELELFKQYMKEQRELLAKDRAEHLEQIKQNDKNKYSTDARMRLMSIL